MIVLFDTFLFFMKLNWEFLHLRHTEPNGSKVRFLLQAPPGGEYPDGEFPGDIAPGKLNRWFPFIPGPLGILGWNLRRSRSIFPGENGMHHFFPWFFSYTKMFVCFAVVFFCWKISHLMDPCHIDMMYSYRNQVLKQKTFKNMGYQGTLVVVHFQSFAAAALASVKVLFLRRCHKSAAIFGYNKTHHLSEKKNMYVKLLVIYVYTSMSLF